MSLQTTGVPAKSNGDVSGPAMPQPGWRASAIHPTDQSTLFRRLDFPDLMKKGF